MTLENKRNEFLLNHWPKYSCAPQGAVDVADFLSSFSTPVSSALVCGRLKLSETGLWTLFSSGAEITLQWMAGTEWLRPPPNFVFHVSLLRSGDLVCLALQCPKSALAKDSFEVSALSLLAPVQGEYRARSAFTIERSQQWACFIGAVREFFVQQEFVEATTPTLVRSPGTEPYLDVFSTDWILGSRRQTFYLPTSPEFHLKKLLVLGWTRIFEFKTCFRNGEVGTHHQPEFHMLEWYRAYRDLNAIAEDVQKLIAFLVDRLMPQKNIAKLKRTTMPALFAQHFDGFHLKPGTSREELVNLARKNQIAVSDTDSWDDVFFRLFLEKIEAQLGTDGPLLVRDYPPKQAALARIGANGFADRFEVYWGGLELANAFHELNDPKENEARFREDHERKKELGKPAVPVDEELVRALYYGLPPSGGIALGLDRLFMAIFDIEDIADTRAFPERA